MAERQTCAVEGRVPKRRGGSSPSPGTNAAPFGDVPSSSSGQDARLWIWKPWVQLPETVPPCTNQAGEIRLVRPRSSARESTGFRNRRSLVRIQPQAPMRLSPRHEQGPGGERVDARGPEPRAGRREGSNPSPGTISAPSSSGQDVSFSTREHRFESGWGYQIGLRCLPASLHSNFLMYLHNPDGQPWENKDEQIDRASRHL